MQVSGWIASLLPYTRLIPQVKVAPKSVSVMQKCYYSFMGVLAYVIGMNLPLFGLYDVIQYNREAWGYQIFRNGRASVFELGVGPSQTVSFFMKLLIQSGVLPLQRGSEVEMQALSSVQLFFGAIATILQAIFHVFAGMYGPRQQLGPVNSILIITQLSIGSILMQVIEQMLENGWGIGGGQNLFQMSQTCISIVWKSLSFRKIETSYGIDVEGAIPAAINYLIKRESKLEALKLAFLRQELPNLINVIATIVIFSIAIYLQGMHRSITLCHVQAGRQHGTREFPIRLLYAGPAPMTILAQVTQTVHMLSQALWKKTGTNILTRLIGYYYEDQEHPGNLYPIGGLAWILSPQASLRGFLLSPVHTILHSAITLVLSGYAGAVWVVFSGESSEQQAKMLIENKWMIPGSRQGALYTELEKLIPVAALTGGIILGALSLAGDAFGALGSGTGLLMTATCLIKVSEEIAKQQFGM